MMMKELRAVVGVRLVGPESDGLRTQFACFFFFVYQEANKSSVRELSGMRKSVVRWEWGRGVGGGRG